MRVEHGVSKSTLVEAGLRVSADRNCRPQCGLLFQSLSPSIERVSVSIRNIEAFGQRRWLWDCYWSYRMRILRMSGDADPEQTLGRMSYVEVMEGDKEFLDAISLRLEQIVAKPKGRFVVSYTQGQPNARKPPTIN